MNLRQIMPFYKRGIAAAIALFQLLASANLACSARADAEWMPPYAFFVQQALSTPARHFAGRPAINELQLETPLALGHTLTTTTEYQKNFGRMDAWLPEHVIARKNFSRALDFLREYRMDDVLFLEALDQLRRGGY